MATTSDELPPEDYLPGASDWQRPAEEPIGDPLAMDPTAIDRLSSLARRRPARPGAPLAVAAGVAALWAALTSYVPLLALLAVAGMGSGAGLPALLRLAGWGWLLSYGVPVQTPADQITLVPLAFSLFAGWRLIRAGVHASRAIGGHRRRSLGPAMAATAAVAVAYAVVGLAVAALVSTTDVAVSPVRSAATLGLFAFVTAGVGAGWHSRAGRALMGRVQRAGLSALLVGAARTGLCAAALMLAAGAAIAGVALATNGSEAASMLASYRAGAAGQIGITLLCLAYAPNVAVWGTAYLLGPGFAVGVDTVVSPGAVLIGPLPGVPVLAGLPTVPLTGLGPALLGLPVVAAICAGVLLARRSPAGWGPLLATAALSGVFGGLLVQATGFAAMGALGSGRLARFGAVDWRVGAVAAGITAVGALIGAAGMRVLPRS
jgi:hypothetical protein